MAPRSASNRSESPDDSDGRQEALDASARGGDYVLKLYITGATPRSTQAIRNVKRVCEEHLKGRYTLEVIDIYQQPEEARSANIIAAPTLIKRLPSPLRKMIGDMAGIERVLVGLDVQKKKE